ncbi:sensor domain-containing protein [Micromonospora arborensis]|uniref:sensor domain-containing protein n=1 Tax=Micromonospora arborensis TaxID=2116518 RepID=UPI00371CE9FD
MVNDNVEPSLAVPLSVDPPAVSPVDPPVVPPNDPAGEARRLGSRIGGVLASRRGRLIGAAAVVVVIALLSGLAFWLWPDDGRRVVSGTTQATVLDAEEASRLVGVTLAAETRTTEPQPPLVADPPRCVMAVGPATQAVHGRGWTAFLSVTYQESEAVADHVVSQTVALYPDAGRAGIVLGSLRQGIETCPSAVRTDANQATSKWTYQVGDTAPDMISWTATQDGGAGWTCHRRARLKGVAVLQVAVCQAGDGGPAAAKLLDRFADRTRG